MTRFDRRLTPARPDLAAAHLKGQVAAAHFVTGRTMHVVHEIADLRDAPSHEAGVDTQVLFGEEVTLYEDREGWGWVQLAGDSYVGYLAMNALDQGAVAATHVVCVKRTFVYPGPNMKLPILLALPLGAGVEAIEEAPPFVRLSEGGYVFAEHLRPREAYAEDFVTVAEGLIGTPYLWGGKSSLGIDCSGLVQLALAQTGVKAPRDTDLQQLALGDPVETREDLSGLQRGDLVFWKGHVGIMRDAEHLLHANAHHMLVASEPLRAARDRIAANAGSEIMVIKRLPA